MNTDVNGIKYIVRGVFSHQGDSSHFISSMQYVIVTTKVYFEVFQEAFLLPGWLVAVQVPPENQRLVYPDRQEPRQSFSDLFKEKKSSGTEDKLWNDWTNSWGKQWNMTKGKEKNRTEKEREGGREGDRNMSRTTVLIGHSKEWSKTAGHKKVYRNYVSNQFARKQYSTI